MKFKYLGTDSSILDKKIQKDTYLGTYLIFVLLYISWIILF